MQIIRDKQAGTLTLVPAKLGEKRFVNAITSLLQPEDKLFYCGRRTDKNEKYMVHLHAGGVEARETRGKITRTVYVGGVGFILRGTSDGDNGEVANLGNICHFGGNELIYIGETNIDGKKSVIIAPKRCKHCGKNIATLAECEWGVCDDCAIKCEHHYVTYFAHGEAGKVFPDEFCDKCGRSKAKENTIGIKMLLKFSEIGFPVMIIVVAKEQSENDQS